MNSNGAKKEKNQTISVYVRVRPQNKQEIAAGNITITDIRGKELTVKNNVTDKYHRSFMFDKIFGPESQQIEVFKTVAEPAVAEIISGYNCTIFAYGQTGTGKTYTMAGGNEQSVAEAKSWKDEKDAGIIPRTLSYLFDELRVQQIEYTVRVSYLELYNEEIFDLLSPPEDNTKLKLYDDVNKKGSVIVAGQTEVSVTTKGEVYKILESGAEKRRTAATLMNAQSSRSHTIFSVTVHTKESSVDGEDLLKTGKLNLVDLAGSENISKSGVTDKRARETSLINTSLLTLGRCIVALTEHRGHIPYRESKLTRLLRDSLGGRTKTSLIATVSPALCNLEETLNTLDYASRAKHITNKPEMNQRLTKNALLKDYEDQISKLQRDLQATRLCNGIYVATENYDEMIKDLNLQKSEISDKINHIRALKEEMEEKERVCSDLQMEIEQHLEVVEEKCKIIDELSTKLDEASSEISTLQVEKEEKEFLVAKHSETEQILHITAVKLLNTAESSTADIDKLHTKLDLISELNKQNKQTYEYHINEFNNKINQIQGKSSNFHIQENSFHKALLEYTNDMNEKQKEISQMHAKLINAYSEYASSLSENEAKLTESQSDINSEIDHIKEQSATKTSENKQFAQDVFEKNLAPTIVAMKKQLSQQSEKIEAVFESFNTLIYENSGSITNKVKELRNDIVAAKLEVYDKIDNAEKTVTKVLHSVLQSLLHEQEVQNKAQENLSIAMKLLMDNQNMFENRNKISKMHCKLATANLSTLSSDLKNYEKDVGLLVKNTMDVTDDIIYDLNLTETESKSITETSSVNLQSALTKAHSITKSIKNISREFVSDVQSRFDDQNDTNNSLIDKSNNTISKAFSNTTDFLQEFRNKLLQHSEVHEKTNDETRDFFDQYYNTIEKQVYVNKDDCSQFESHTMMDLEDCRENFKKLFTTHIKEYKPTGYTPIRKKYKYPKSVPPTTSSEAVLEDFRKTKFEIPLEENETNNTCDTEKENSDVCEIFEEKISSENVENKPFYVSAVKFLAEKPKNILTAYTGGNIPVPKKKQT